MLCWPHGASINIHVWINLDRCNFQARGLQKEAR